VEQIVGYFKIGLLPLKRPLMATDFTQDYQSPGLNSNTTFLEYKGVMYGHTATFDWIGKKRYYRGFC
jgi:hypothetical protein